MTVEINLETERLVRDEINSGHFHNVDDLIVQTVRAWRESKNREQTGRKAKKNFAQFLLDSPLPGSGLILERRKDQPRPVDL